MRFIRTSKTGSEHDSSLSIVEQKVLQAAGTHVAHVGCPIILLRSLLTSVARTEPLSILHSCLARSRCPDAPAVLAGGASHLLPPARSRGRVKREREDRRCSQIQTQSFLHATRGRSLGACREA